MSTIRKIDLFQLSLIAFRHKQKNKKCITFYPPSEVLEINSLYSRPPSRYPPKRKKDGEVTSEDEINDQLDPTGRGALVALFQPKYKCVDYAHGCRLEFTSMETKVRHEATHTHSPRKCPFCECRLAFVANLVEHLKVGL